MAQPGTAQLRSAAFDTLKSLGYTKLWGTLDGCRSRSVQKMSKDGDELWLLLQCRHHQSESDRYLIGVIVDALRRVDQVAFFFEGETRIPIFPSTFLSEILDKHKKAGDARFTGEHDEQWRIDIHLSDEQLSPQGSNGQRYNISSYVHRVSL